MILMSSWQQSPLFEPDNPGQMVQERYTGLPGGYSSFYFNRVPNDAVLQGSSLAAAQGSKVGWVLGALFGLAAVAYMTYAVNKE